MFRKKREIIIIRPWGHAGGQMVLSELCVLLRKKGYNAKLLYIYIEPERDTTPEEFWAKWKDLNRKNIISRIMLFFFGWLKNNPRIKEYEDVLSKEVPATRFKMTRRIDDDAIVIYPEHCFGNILGARNVVRWLMYHPFKDASSTWGSDDLVVAYRDVFNDPERNPKGYILNVHCFDRQLYRRYNFGARSGNCYFVRKGRDRADLPKSFDGPVLDKLPEKEKVRILNQCERCYSYDLQTFYSSIAAICGCESIVVMEHGKTKYDYYSEADLKVNFGVAFGDTPEERAHAKATLPQLEEKLNFDKANEENVNRFIKIMTERFGPLK